MWKKLFKWILKNIAPLVVQEVATEIAKKQLPKQ